MQDLDVQQAPEDSQLPEKSFSSRTSTSGNTVKTKTSVQDLDLQQAPADSQLPDSSNGMDIPNLFSVQGKVVLVTGGAKGLAHFLSKMMSHLISSVESVV